MELITSKQINPKPLLICSGGTTSRCASDEHWTLDLRKKYQFINFDKSTKEVEIGGGIKMKNLLEELSKHGRCFPTGLSGETGLGYILTGGISPISRSKGLAIDQVLKIKGIWGKGQNFEISKPSSDSSIEEYLMWRGLSGASPFLGIITSLRVKTHIIKPFKKNIFKTYFF